MPKRVSFLSLKGHAGENRDASSVFFHGMISIFLQVGECFFEKVLYICLKEVNAFTMMEDTEKKLILTQSV